jgi:glycine/D-amino acid oxidase-like deaminating enzyme
VIVGGAVVGSATAFFLADNPDFGGSVLVIERDWSYARSATALSSSSIRQQFSNPVNVQLSQFGTAFIREFSVHVSVDGEAPEIAFRENGYLFLASSGGRAVLERNHAVQKSLSVDVVLLSPDALVERFPWVNPEGIELASLGQSGEGWFDSHGLLMGFRNKARSLGVEYIEDEVVGVRRDGDRVTGVLTESGAEIDCGALVNTAGTRGPRIAQMAGLALPVEPRRRSLFVFDCRDPLPGAVPLTIDPSGVFFRPEGRFYLAGTSPREDVAVDVDDFAVRHEEFEEQIWPVLASRVPAFEAIKVVNAWAGHYDYCVLDHNVIVGPHPLVRNFLFANGFSGHGLQQSPGVGRALSELLTYGAFRTLDLSPLSYERVAANRPFFEDAVI